MKNKIDHKEVEVALHKIKEHVTTTYFFCSPASAAAGITADNRGGPANRNTRKVQAAIKHGAALPSDTNVMKVRARR
ncbi:MAG: hypothetical protein U5L09_12225 [Bacteroidales bacterium]|nr:hypothetical protein [Bacteroidales bacterium]